jgi:hypothetical protein
MGAGLAVDSPDLQTIVSDHETWLTTNTKSGARAELAGADLRNAELHATNLRQANLSKANLSGADLFEVSLRDADLQGADLTDAKGLRSHQVSAPEGFSSARLTGKANVDDTGRVFLNGRPISPSIFSHNALVEFGNVSFSANGPEFFKPGAVNEILVSDVNTGAGPSGAAFYFTIAFRK